MDVTLACIAGEEIYRQWDPRRNGCRKLEAQKTPFGDSAEMFMVIDAPRPYIVLPRHGAGMTKKPHGRINHRANLYALKDRGVQAVLAWGPGGAITHDVAVGDILVLNDVIDRTYLRDKTFFENSPLGFLRQFPVFCPVLRRVACQTMAELGLHYHDGGSAAVSEGPRLETPAEIRMLAHIGADLVTHTFVPEVFLAKELQLCYAGVLYVVNYAETGSRHRPFASGGLFGGLTEVPEAERLARSLGAMKTIVEKVAEAMASGPPKCGCRQSMATQVNAYDLPPDWRQWFSADAD